MAGWRGERQFPLLEGPLLLLDPGYQDRRLRAAMTLRAQRLHEP